MWQSHSETVDSQTIKVRLSSEGRFLTFREALLCLQTNDALRSHFAATIAAAPFRAFFWETPPIANNTLDRQFEFVVLEGDSLLQLQADPSPFEAKFLANPKDKVVAFPNLGNDALLVVPKPVADRNCYAHLANFLRNGPKSQVSELWKCAGAELQKRISDRPTWMSTAGLGVSWLHLRLDSRPKYLRFNPYKTAF